MIAPIWLRFTESKFRYPIKYTLKKQFEQTNVLVDEIDRVCKEDCYNIVAHKHMGDVFYLLGLNGILEKEYGAKFHYILRPQHEFLAKLWGITNYSVFPIDKFIKKNRDFITAFFDDQEPDSQEIDHRLENPYLMASFSSIPQKGKPFIIDNIFNNFYDYPYYWCFRWAQNLGIEREFRFEIPRGIIPLSDRAQTVVEGLGGVDNIIILAPEAATSIELPPEWWNAIADALSKKGYKILVNSKRIKIQNTLSVYDVNLNLEEVVAIALKCKAIFSLRSGLADVLVSAANRLYVFNPAMLRREQGSLDYPFNTATGVNELQLYNWDISNIQFEDINLRLLLLPYIRFAQQQFYKEKCLSIFNKEGHSFWYKIFQNIAGRSLCFPENNIMNPPPSTWNVSIGRLQLYQRKSYYNASVESQKRSILNGLISTERNKLNSRIRIMGCSIYSKKCADKTTVKLLGIPIYRKDRRKIFLANLKKWIIAASEEAYGKNIIADQLFVVRHNMGESVLYYSYFESWAKQSGSKHPLLLIWRDRDLPFVRLFLKDKPYIKFCGLLQRDINSFLKKDVLFVDNIKINVPTYEIAEAMKSALCAGSNTNFVDWIMKSMALDPQDKHTLPQVSVHSNDKAKWLLTHAGITNNYILLCPEAMSLRSESDDLWLRLADFYSDAGYSIFINSCADLNHNPKLNKYPHGAPDIDVLFSIAQKATRIISMASGLGVLLSLTGKPVDLIYTNFNNPKIGYNAELAKRIYSVKYLPFTAVSQAKEHISNDSESLFNEIVMRKL